VILLCNREDHESAAALLHAGAWDYFTRPVDILRMQGVLLHLRYVRDIEHNMARKKTSFQRGRSIGQSDAAPETVPSMDHARERAIRRALKASGGNVKEAARLLGIGRTTIYKLMHKFRINHRQDASDTL
jgi:DNA-binding NtrC family response regulator